MGFFLVYLMGYMDLPKPNYYIVPCCGFITRWTAFIDAASSLGDLYLQVWRLHTGQSWTLVGQNKVSVSVNSKQVL